MNNQTLNQPGGGRTMSASLICPVCRVRFRGSKTCSRCGADLGPLMLLSAHAARLRTMARQAIREGDHTSALRSVLEAQRIHRTPQGDLLRFFLEVGLTAHDEQIQDRQPSPLDAQK